LEEPVEFQHNHTLALNPHNLKRVYGVNIEFNEEGKEKQSLRFELEVLAKKNDENKTWLFQFDRRNVFINLKKPDTIADKLAYECGQVIYPLQIEVTNNWSKRTIKSRPLAIEQLKKLEEKIKMTYKSSHIDTYFLKTWETINNPASFVKAVEQNMFLSFFFAPLYQQYNTLTNIVENTLPIPIIPFCKAISYNVKQKVLPKYTRFNTITVVQKGIIEDKRSIKDLENKFDDPIFKKESEADNLLGELNAKYELHKETRVIQSLTVDASIKLKDNKTKSFNMQVYYLSERDKIANQSVFHQIPILKKETNVE